MLSDLNNEILVRLNQVFGIQSVIKVLPSDLSSKIKQNIGNLQSQESKEFITILVISLRYKVYKITNNGHLLFGFSEEEILDRVREQYPDKQIIGEFIHL